MAFHSRIPIHKPCIHIFPVQKNGIQYTLPPLPSPLSFPLNLSQFYLTVRHLHSLPSPIPHFCPNAAAPAAPRVHYELRKQPGPAQYMDLIFCYRIKYRRNRSIYPLFFYENGLFTLFLFQCQHSCKQCCCSAKQEEVSCQIGRVSGLRNTS